MSKLEDAQAAYEANVARYQDAAEAARLASAAYDRLARDASSLRGNHDQLAKLAAAKRDALDFLASLDPRKGSSAVAAAERVIAAEGRLAEADQVIADAQAQRDAVVGLNEKLK